MSMRDVLVHYHLFKNAGSSIDRCLNASFGDQWLAFDPEAGSGLYTADELDEIILQNPTVTAFSSHCIVPPVLNRVARIHPVVILREPISRTMSAYLFEWKKQKNLAEPSGTLGEYISAKFEHARASAIEDFQTIRLATTDPKSKRPARNATDEQLVQSACEFIDGLTAFGLVERFAESVAWLQDQYSPIFPSLDLKPVAANVTQTADVPMSQRHESIHDAIGQELFDELVSRNSMDTRLYDHAVGRFDELTNSGASEDQNRVIRRAG